MPIKDKQSIMLRQWQLLKLLPPIGTGKSALQLTAELNDLGFNISKRQVERDLNELMEIFTLDRDDRSIPHGWKWLKGASADLPAMTISEALSLRLVEGTLKTVMPLSMLGGLEARFSQAEKQLNSLSKENNKAKWIDKVRSVQPTMPLIPPVVDSNILATVQEALLADLQLEMNYKGMNDDAARNVIVSPLALVNRGSVSYLVATNFNNEQVRLYAIHRIKEANKTTTSVSHPDNFDVDDYIKAGGFEFSDGNVIVLKANLAPWLAQILEETPLSIDQTLRYSADKIKLTATVTDSWQLVWWIMSLGAGIEIVAPTALRNKLAQKLVEAAGQYN